MGITKRSFALVHMAEEMKKPVRNTLLVRSVTRESLNDGEVNKFDCLRTAKGIPSERAEYVHTNEASTTRCCCDEESVPAKELGIAALAREPGLKCVRVA